MKTILVTGGSGFLGQNLALQLKKDYNVVLASRNNKRNLMAQNITGCPVVPMDISQIESVRDAVSEISPDIIIHAAATKFVDLSEKFPMECIDINVVGSQNVARVAIDKGVDLVIGISTDKASPPVRNTYGMSKSIMERLYCSLGKKGGATSFMCVRYGNVAWSTGSVLPIWKKMHDETNVISSTGPDMRRYFFTVDEAVELVIAALNNSEKLNGKVLSRPMKAATIRDVFTVWIEEYGGTWEKIKGRPGERDDEFLIGELEISYSTEVMFDNKPYYVIDFSQKTSNPVSGIVSTSNAEKLNRDGILKLIKAHHEH